MTKEGLTTSSEETEQRRFSNFNLRRAGVRAARVAVLAVGIAYFTGDKGVDSPAEVPAPVTSPDTTGQGDIDFRFTLDEDVAECRERMQALDDCIASDFGGTTNKEPATGQVDAPYSTGKYISECRELLPLDVCIASGLYSNR